MNLLPSNGFTCYNTELAHKAVTEGNSNKTITLKVNIQQNLNYPNNSKQIFIAVGYNS
jgi:hypothetical protein